MKRNDSIVAKAWTRDLSSIPALAMRLAERCRTISTPFLSAPRVQASNHRLLERPLPGNLRLGGQRLLVADLGHFGIHREVWISANHPQPPLGGKWWQPLWFELGTS